MIGGKWKPLFLFSLKDEPMRFSELRRNLPDIARKMLTSRLWGFERDGIVHREIYPQVPPKMEYSLTACGRKLAPLLDAMAHWRIKHRRRDGRGGGFREGG